MFRAVLLAFTAPCVALDNGAALTPPMGWSTWNKLKCKYNEQALLVVADAMVSSGMVEAGYKTLNIDDCWMLRKRQAGQLTEDPGKFPRGMGKFSGALQDRGIGLGIYTSHGNFTCQKFPGSYGYEEADARTFADWNVQFVKNDWCSNRRGFPAVPDLQSFQRMRDALNRTGKHMTYSIHWNYDNTKAPSCDKGVSCPLPELANMWRVGGDIKASWGKVLGLIDIAEGLAKSAAPGQWNDLDMLEVGNGMSPDQDQAHFTMWCMLASPLIAGNDVRNMSDVTRRILTNTHAIAVNQDSLGRQAILKASNTNGTGQVWLKELAEPRQSYALAILNRDHVAQNVVANLSDIGAGQFEVFDLWKNATSLGIHDGLFATSLSPTSAAMYKIVPAETSFLV